MQENEIALFCIEAKTGLSVLEDGGRPTRLSDEYCRVSSDLSELRAHAKRIIEDHPTIVCILRAKDKSKVETIRKRRGTLSTLQLIAAFAGLIVCALAITVVGFAVLFSLRLCLRKFGWRLQSNSDTGRLELALDELLRSKLHHRSIHYGSLNVGFRSVSGPPSAPQDARRADTGRTNDVRLNQSALSFS